MYQKQNKRLPEEGQFCPPEHTGGVCRGGGRSDPLVKKMVDMKARDGFIYIPH